MSPSSKQRPVIPQTVLIAAKRVKVPNPITPRDVIDAAELIKISEPHYRDLIFGQPSEGTVTLYLFATYFQIWPPLEVNNSLEINNPAARK